MRLYLALIMLGVLGSLVGVHAPATHADVMAAAILVLLGLSGRR